MSVFAGSEVKTCEREKRYVRDARRVPRVDQAESILGCIHAACVELHVVEIGLHGARARSSNRARF